MVFDASSFACVEIKKDKKMSLFYLLTINPKKRCI
jgi:hypothetical protein